MNTQHRTRKLSDTTIHARCRGNVLVYTAIHANTYQHVLGCVILVFGIYEITIRANTDQIHAYFFMIPIQFNIDPVYIELYWANTCPNTDQYKHQYRRIHTTQFSILAPAHANTGISTVKSGAPARHYVVRALYHFSLAGFQCQQKSQRKTQP